jgi:acyl-CoA synthetase (AMP-forming)/AMP-acid ligase II
MIENIVEWQARRNPDHPAIQTEDGVVTYGALARDVAAMTTALAKENLPPGVALIGPVHPAMHWLLTLALERLGHATVYDVKALEKTAALVGASVAIAVDPTFTATDGVRVLHLDGAWRRQALAQAPSRRRRAAKPDDLVRIILSSGTTGERKAVPITRQVIDARLGRPLITEPPLRPRSLQTMGMDTTGGYHQPLFAWLHGGVIIIPSPLTRAAFETYRPDSIMSVSPAHLRVLLPWIGKAYSEDVSLRIGIGGSAAPPSLLRELAACPGLEASVRYGSTETGMMACGPAELTLRRPGAVGHLLPWTEMEIVDEDGRAAPQGRSGAIRVRGAGVIDGYWVEGSRIDPFPDGWFYPNDVGRIDPDGVLVIEGRRDDVVNIGGLKLSATRVEETLLTCEGVVDAAVAVFPTVSGRWALHAAIVPSPAFDAAAARQAVRDAYDVQLDLVQLASIPRNGMGKIVRTALKQAIIEATKTASQEPRSGV